MLWGQMQMPGGNSSAPQQLHHRHHASMNPCCRFVYVQACATTFITELGYAPMHVRVRARVYVEGLFGQGGYDFWQDRARVHFCGPAPALVGGWASHGLAPSFAAVQRVNQVHLPRWTVLLQHR